MKPYLTVGIILISLSATAQDTAKSAQDTVKTTVFTDGPTFVKVEIEAEYPGGTPAWNLFLGKNLHYPDAALGNGIQGTVMVRFIVDTAGNISDIKAISGPAKGGLREEAVRVVGISGKWTPAIQNAHKVRSYKKIPLQFKLMVN